MRTFHVDILAADKPFYRGDCQSLQIPIGNGQYGILAEHCNAIAAIVPGTILPYLLIIIVNFSVTPFLLSIVTFQGFIK